MLAPIRLVAAMTLAAGPSPAAPGAPGAPGALSAAAVVAAITVHGNAATPDDEVIRLAGVSVGTAFEADTIINVETRLNASGRFEHAQVLKRFASLADPTQILLVIIVDEGPVK